MPSYYQPSHSHTITKTQFESNLAYGFIVILHYMINFSRNFPPNQLYCNRYSRYDSDAAYYVLNTTPTCYNDHTQQRLGRAFPCQRRLYGVSSTTFAADDLTVGATSLPKNCLEDEREREKGGGGGVRGLFSVRSVVALWRTKYNGRWGVTDSACCFVLLMPTKPTPGAEHRKRHQYKVQAINKPQLS